MPETSRNASSRSASNGSRRNKRSRCRKNGACPCEHAPFSVPRIEAEWLQPSVSVVHPRGLRSWASVVHRVLLTPKLLACHLRPVTHGAELGPLDAGVARAAQTAVRTAYHLLAADQLRV